MKLSMEEVQKIKANVLECEDLEKCHVFGDGNLVCSMARRCKEKMNFIDTIEALQHEIVNNLNPDIESYKLTIDLKDDEISHLQAQLTAMREALSEAISSTTSGRLCSIGSFQNTYSAQISTTLIDKLTNILSSDAGKNYHNPVDIDILKQMLCALRLMQSNIDHGFAPDIETKDAISQSIAAIEKALSGL